MIFHKIFAVMCLLSASQFVHADSINIQLSNESARFMYAAEVFGGQFGPTDLEVGAYFNEEDDTVAHVSLVLRSDSIDNPLIAAIGGRVYYGDVGNAPTQTQADVAALAFGVALQFRPEGLGASIRGYYFISPSVTSFMDADTFTEFGVSLDFDITDQVGIYVGYRNMSTDLDNGTEIEIDDSVMYGVLFRF
jgi:hypothetical protein